MTISVARTYHEIPPQIAKQLNNANLFFSKEYSEYTIKRAQQLLYIWSEAFILPVRIKKQFFLVGAVLESEPYRLSSASLEDEKAFLDVAMNFLKEAGVQWVVTASTSMFETAPSQSVHVQGGSHMINLTLPIEDIWNKIDSKHKNSIRRAEKNGVIIEHCTTKEVLEYVNIEKQTYARSKKVGRSLDYYQQLLQGLPNNAVCFLARKDGEVQAGGLFLYNSAMSYYLHGATKNNPEGGSANLLQWYAIQYMKEKGVQKYSFVGYCFYTAENQKLEGIQRFKKRFGGTLATCSYFKVGLKPLFYQIYTLAMQLRSPNKLKRYEDEIDSQFRQMNLEHE